jgi:cytochrome b561
MCRVHAISQANETGKAGMRMTGSAEPGQTSYSRTAIALHWSIAALLIANLALGFWHDAFGKSASAWLMFFHKSIGFSVLVLTCARLAWRLFHRPPPFDGAMKIWEARLARAVHALFYVLMFAMPVSGMLFSSSWNRATPVFGLFQIPPLPAPASPGAQTLFGNAHEALGFATIALIMIHVAGALKHHLQGHRHLIGRMAPWRTPIR